MAVKYTIPYRSIDDTPWRVDILLDSWTDPAITVRGSADSACTIEYDGGVDDPFDNPVVTSKAAIQLINQGEVDMDELQYAGDRDFVVEVYRDNVLKWKGYLITDNIQQPLLSAPNVVQLSAIDGLNMLEGITYTHNNLQTEGQGIAVRSPLNYLRQCLFASSNLGLMLPIRWYVGLENVVTEDDAIAGMMTWSPYGDGFIVGQSSDGTIYQNCRYIVEGLVKSMKGARIFQADGCWNIFPPNDVIGGSFTYNKCDATLDAPTITQHAVNITRTVSGRGQGADYEFIREDGLLTVKPALGLVDVEYDSDRRENILPNGGLDVWSLGAPLYWGFNDVSGDSPLVTSHESLDGRDGYAAEVSNGALFPATENAEFTYGGRLPVDSTILVKRFTMGFKFMGVSGFPILTSEEDYGTIIWDQSPLRVRVSFQGLDSENNETMLFLNRWGYWQPTTYTPTPMEIVSQSTTAAYEATFAGTPMKGDRIVVRFTHTSSPQPDVEYDYVVTDATSGDLAAVLAAFAATISGASSTATTITIPTPPSGPWDGIGGIIKSTNNLLDGDWIKVDFEGLRIGDIASFVFEGRAGNSEIILPGSGDLDGSQLPDTGTIKIEFAVLPEQTYVLDDVFIRVEDNNDVYRVNSPATGNSTSQRITMGISSSFSGFMVSNMMRGYSTSNEDFIWSDGSVTASLTEHYARAVMRWRYKPSRIFNGTLNTRTKDWSFFEVYSLLGSNFLPLNAKYNTEKCEVWTVAMEGRDDGVITDVKHYASNNMPLSNYGG